MHRNNAILAPLTLLIPAIMLVFGNYAFAQESTPTTTSPAPVVPIDLGPNSSPETPTLLPSPTTPRQFDRPVALGERAQARVVNLAANMSTRFETATKRYEHIIGRLEARSALMREQGFDTTQAEASLMEAKAGLVNVKLSMATIDRQVKDAVTAADGRQAWEAVRVVYTRNNNSVRAIHNNLRASVAALRAARTGDSAATTTLQTS